MSEQTHSLLAYFKDLPNMYKTFQKNQPHTGRYCVLGKTLMQAIALKYLLFSPELQDQLYKKQIPVLEQDLVHEIVKLGNLKSIDDLFFQLGIMFKQQDSSNIKNFQKQVRKVLNIKNPIEQHHKKQPSGLCHKRKKIQDNSTNINTLQNDESIFVYEYSEQQIQRELLNQKQSHQTEADHDLSFVKKINNLNLDLQISRILQAQNHVLAQSKVKAVDIDFIKTKDDSSTIQNPSTNENRPRKLYQKNYAKKGKHKTLQKFGQYNKNFNKSRINHNNQDLQSQFHQSVDGFLSRVVDFSTQMNFFVNFLPGKISLDKQVTQKNGMFYIQSFISIIHSSNNFRLKSFTALGMARNQKQARDDSYMKLLAQAMNQIPMLFKDYMKYKACKRKNFKGNRITLTKDNQNK